MEKVLKPCTVVPENLYVERNADKQIHQIIEGMGRPGYVLVARQMGKTNLLLHTKKQMETSSVLFTFIDFSIIGGYSETECFNHLIDETINLHIDVLSDAENEISELRQKNNYSGYKMFTRELRIILKYVDKLVFILDEIDALARTDYSDRVFSTIRSHYFQRENYKELNKLTYILSGVIEPKDIIKDPNISPFNIGEKIYMNDFTHDEYNTFISNVGIKELDDILLQNRIYYWTKGNPRMTWDVCSLVEELKIKSEEELDNAIRKYYLTSFDKAPIDAIRQKVQDEEVLKDALIQLYFNKGESLSVEVKNQLYLAGIIDFDNNRPQIKNPILDSCLGYDWLMSLESKKPDYLTEADHAIWINKDYKKAITFLNHYLEEEHSLDEIDKANYLLGFAHYRLFNIEYAEKSFNIIKERGFKSKYYYPAILILAYAYTSSEEYDKALNCYSQIIGGTKTEDEVSLKALVGKVGLLIKTENENNLNEAEQILFHVLNIQLEDTVSLNVISLCHYYLACIYELRQSSVKAVGYIDLALNGAQQNEKQVLLYKKLNMVVESDKSFIAEELFQSLSKIETKPQAEDLDNPLAFNQVIACQILATLILEYPKYDVNKYLRLFLFDSKENAIIYIDTILHQLRDKLASPFFSYIKKLLTNENWNFEDEQKANIALLDWNRNSNKKLACEYVSRIFSNPIHDVGIKGVEILMRLTHTSLLHNKLDEAVKYYHLYDDNVTDFRGITIGQRILFDYYYANILYRKDPIRFRTFGVKLLKRAIDYRDNYNKKNKGDRLKINDVEDIIKNLSSWESQVVLMMRKLGIEKNSNIELELGRNSIIKVKYVMDDKIFVGKYKKYQEDIVKGFCEIISMIKK